MGYRNRKLYCYTSLHVKMLATANLVAYTVQYTCTYITPSSSVSDYQLESA